MKILVISLNGLVCSGKSVWALRGRECYIKSRSKYKNSSLVKDRASMQHSNLSLNVARMGMVSGTWKQRKRIVVLSAMPLLAVICCSGASWARGGIMMFSSLWWFFFPGLYPVISNSICLKLVFKIGRKFMKYCKLHCFIGIHGIIYIKIDNFKIETGRFCNIL